MKISDNKRWEEILRESTKNYRKIVNLSPEIIVITMDGIIVLANKLTFKYFGQPIGEKLESFTTPDFIEIMRIRMHHIKENKIEQSIFEYKLICMDNSIMDVEIVSSYFSYKGKSAILSLIRDISERKKELNEAANFQTQVLKKKFPILSKVEMEILYVPAKTVSGDFYFFHKIDESLVIGILGDVSGKGVTAALNISAFNVLFHEAVLINHDPIEIIRLLNKKVANYLGERFIAACCFSFDFIRNEVKVVGAGISQFLYQVGTDKCSIREVRGPFLGMFEESTFDIEVIKIKSGDKFYFYTDGLEFAFPDDQNNEKFIEKATATELLNYLNITLRDMLTVAEGIKDDSTLLVLKII